MKTIKKIFFLFSILTLAAACAEKTYDIADQIDFPRCMKPTQLKAEVVYTNAILSWRIFPDAQSYKVELYTAEIPEEGEPDAADLYQTLTVAPKEIPYTFAGPEEQTLFFRVQALNESKEASHWSESKKFTTTTDPATICTKPTDMQAVVNFQEVSFQWGTYPDTKYYVFEVYSKSIPTTGEPDAANLVLSRQVDVKDVPFSVKFDAVAKYYYRVCACNPESGRRNSKWATGSFETVQFNWPEDPDALNEAMTAQMGLERFGLEASGSLKADVTLDKITYMNGCSVSSDKVSIGSWSDDNSYNLLVPKTQKYIWCKICRPGEFNFIPRNGKGASLVVAVLTTKPGEGKKVTYVYDSPDGIEDKKNEANRKYIKISEDLLYGITEAATVYFFATPKASGMTFYPISWTPEEKGK